MCPEGHAQMSRQFEVTHVVSAEFQAVGTPFRSGPEGGARAGQL